MLFGNMIFIKKTGGDGSKYPVTQKNIKIGRSEDCLIRIYNPQVAPEHCQLIIDDNGQAKLRNLSYCTILNGKPLSQGDVTLCHGDVFKLGERLARWEYLPTSKYYKQPLSPTGRLVAVVMPQQRSAEGTPGASTSQYSVSKSTPVGTKRRYSERLTLEGGSAKKVSRVSSASKALKKTSNVTKFLTARHSLKGTKALLQGSKGKQRKSTSGVVSEKTPKPIQKSRKSTLPSWRVNIVTPPSTEKAVHGKSGAVKSLTPIPAEKFVKSLRKSTVKTPLRTIVESPPKVEKDSPRSTPSKGKASSLSPAKASLSTPKNKQSPRLLRTVQSEKKLKSVTQNSPDYYKELKRMSLVLERAKTPRKSDIKKLCGSASRKAGKTSKPSEAEVYESNVFAQMLPAVELIDEMKGVPSPRKSTKLAVSLAKSTPTRMSSKTSKVVESTPLRGESLSDQESAVSLGKRLSDRKASSTQSPAVNSTPARGRPASVKSTSPRKSSSPVKEKSASPRGIRRKLTPSISSAERAAKKLKTSSPRKPDKNKKAALLVLGKANRKQLLLQKDVKVLLKQKIVKKAIKMAPGLKDENKKINIIKKTKKTQTKAVSKRKKKPIKEGKGKKQTNSSSNEKAQGSEEGTPKNKSLTEENLTTSKPASEMPLRSSKIMTPDGQGTPKSPSRQSKKSVSVSTPEGNLMEKFTSDSYLFASNRRSSKRLSSKNDTSRPDFMELSPTALGLIPKNVEMFKTPKEKKRRSSSLATPKSVRTPGIIKSASTSKITHRKSVRFSSKDFSFTSGFSTSGAVEFDSFQTPNITLDLFVSPLLDGSKNNLYESGRIATEDKSSKTIVSSSKTPKISSTPKKCVRKLLQSPLTSVEKVSQEAQRSSRASKATESPQVPKVGRPSKNTNVQKSPKNDLSGVEDVRYLFANFKSQKSPRNNLTDLQGVRRLLQTPREVKSPKNDLTDVKGVKKLLQTPRVQKSPKNDLTDVKGVKKLLRTPKVQKSPKNDLTDVKGVKKLLQTPKVQKSPLNDLSNVKGVKKLLQTPKVQKSPKNDLTDVKGVKKLLSTPKIQKSPKNDLTDVRGVKQLLQSPRIQKSPTNDLTDVRGVKRLLSSPKNQKSPKNDLTDVKGVKQLLGTPKAQKSPKNDLSDVRGVKQLLQTPKNQKSPKNELTDLAGVAELFEQHKDEKSPSRKSFLETSTPRSPKNLGTVTGVKQLLVAKSPEMLSTNKKSSPRKSHVSDLRSIRGRRTIYSTPKGPKNDLSDVTGVRELFSRHKPPGDFEISLTGVAELFDLPTARVEIQKLTTAKSSRRKTLASVPSKDENEEEVTTRSVRSRKGRDEVEKKSTRGRKLDASDISTTDVTEKKTTKRKAAEKVVTPEPKKQTVTRGRKSQAKATNEAVEEEVVGTRSTRKRKATDAEPEPSPPKLRRKPATGRAASKTATSKSEVDSTEITKSSRKTPAKAKDSKASKTTPKVQTKTSKTSTRATAKGKEKKSPETSKVQKKTATKTSGTTVTKVQTGRSQTSSRRKVAEKSGIVEISPRKTRSVSRVQTKTVATK